MNGRFALAVIAILAGLFWLAAARADDATDWIHKNFPMCCDHRDCMAVRARPSATGWIVDWHGGPVSYAGPLRPSPNDSVIACGTQSHIRCLFIPGGTV